MSSCSSTHLRKFLDSHVPAVFHALLPFGSAASSTGPSSFLCPAFRPRAPSPRRRYRESGRESGGRGRVEGEHG